MRIVRSLMYERRAFVQRREAAPLSLYDVLIVTSACR
jgi:hypothetical protein